MPQALQKLRGAQSITSFSSYCSPPRIRSVSFALSAADHLLKDDNDNPSIGLLVCKSKNETVVKWAFEGIDRPLGIATYELDEVLKKTLAEKLPSIEDIENAIEE